MQNIDLKNARGFEWPSSGVVELSFDLSDMERVVF
jgi:hypothetical protein